MQPSVYRWWDDEAQVPQVLVDAGLAFLVQIGRRGTGRSDLSPREIHLTTTALDAGGTHDDFFDVRFVSVRRETRLRSSWPTVASHSRLGIRNFSTRCCRTAAGS